jgi:hypothetical protein
MKIFFQQDMPPRMSNQQRKRLENRQKNSSQVWMKNSRYSSKRVTASETIARLGALQFTKSLISEHSLGSMPSLSGWILDVNNSYKRLERKLARTLEQMPPSVVKNLLQNTLTPKYRPQKGGVVAAALQKALIRYYR